MQSALRLRFLTLVITAVCFSSLAQAQSTRAQLTGVVTDTTGAVGVDATVTVTNLATNVSQTTSSNQQGIYRFQNLIPGPYRLEATLTGFKTFSQEPITLRVGDVVGLDITLEVGQVTEVVEVSAAAGTLESETASLGDVITGRALDEIPLGIRDAFQLVFLSPAVVPGLVAPSSSQPDERLQNRASFKIAGGRDFSQELLVDGTPNSGVDFGSAAYVPPPDVIQEFKVHTNTFSAEYGRTTGGVVDMVTKSGTSELHGSVYDFFRNDALDANNFFSNRAGDEKPSLRRNQFGAAVGGQVPYGSNTQKTFFFFGYEGFRLRTPEAGLLTMPTELHRQGDFSQTFLGDGRLIQIFDPETLRTAPDGSLVRDPFLGNRIPQSRFDPTAQRIMNLYPQPTSSGDPVTQTNNFSFSGSRKVDVNNWTVRADHNFGAKNRLFGRWSRLRYDRGSFRAFEAQTGEGNNDDRGMNVVISDNHSFSPTLIGEVTVSYTRHNTNEFCPPLGFDLTSIGLPRSLQDFTTFPCIPFFNVSGMSQIGWPRFLAQPRNTTAGQGSISKQFNRHFVKVGFQHRKYNFNLTRNLNTSGTFNFSQNFTRGPDPFTTADNAGFGFASLLLGTGSGGGVFKEAPLSIYRLYSAAYVQDDWKVTPRLTINLGLRWDLNQGTRERHNRLSSLDLDARSPLSDQAGFDLRGLLEFRGEGVSENLSALDKNDFGPRVGLAYKLTDDTVIRAGYGIFYVPLIAINGVGTQGFETDTPWVATLDNGLTPENLISDPFPGGFNLPRVDRNPLQDVGFGLGSSTREDRTGYTQQWNLSIQHQLTNDTLFDIAYAGNKGTKLPWADFWQANFLPNQFLDLGPAALNEQVPNPFFGGITNPASSLSRRTVARRQLLLPFPQYTSIQRFYPSTASSIYHSIQFKIQKQAASGLHLMASYTISKQIDDSSVMRGWLDANRVGGPPNWENLRLERSVSSLDTPQRLVASYVYDLPIGRNKAVGGGMSKGLDAVIGGWQLSGVATFQSGRPVGINRFQLSTGQTAKLDNPTIDRWFNTDVFVPAPTVGLASLGNVGRMLPDVRADGANNFDLSAAKNFFFDERYRLQFRADFLNAFNTPQFGFPNGNRGPNFGTVRNLLNGPRSIQLGLRLAW